MGRTTKGQNRPLDWLHAHASYEGDWCLIWPFNRVRGYGQLFTNIDGSKRAHYAHRFMCELVNGPPPTPKHHAAHTCNRGDDGCVHPKHLVWKTPSENMLDKRKTGIYYRDGRHRKLTDADVLQIRSLAGSATHDELADMFGVSRRNVGMIIAGQTRANAGDASGQLTSEEK